MTISAPFLLIQSLVYQVQMNMLSSLLILYKRLMNIKIQNYAKSV